MSTYEQTKTNIQRKVRIMRTLIIRVDYEAYKLQASYEQLTDAIQTHKHWCALAEEHGDDYVDEFGHTLGWWRARGKKAVQDAIKEFKRADRATKFWTKRLKSPQCWVREGKRLVRL